MDEDTIKEKYNIEYIKSIFNNNFREFNYPLYKRFYSTDDNINVKGGFCVVVNLNSPFSFVNVPRLLPLIVTETAAMASPDFITLTLPETIVPFCAVADRQMRLATQLKRTFKILFINNSFWLVPQINNVN
jgi:hypothetical protein